MQQSRRATTPLPNQNYKCKKENMEPQYAEKTGGL